MKKGFAAVLSLLLLVSSVSVLFTLPAGAATVSPVNLVTNSNFATSTGVIPDGWTFTGGAVANLSAGIDTVDKSPDGSNSFKFTQTAPISAMAYFYNTNAVTLKKNCDYTVSMWVKTNNIKSMRFYLYEPVYVNKAGTTATSQTPIDGQNTYSYSYNNGSTRVIRTNITHTFKLNNAILSSGPSSMAIVRDAAGTTQLDVSTDFPAQTGINQWTKLTYTFTTGLTDADVASVRYAVGLKDGLSNAGTASIADITFNEVQKPFAFTPAVNDGDLGGVFPKTLNMMETQQNLTFVANPTDGNSFIGWTLNGTDYSTNPVVTGTFSQSDVLKANFAADNIVTNPGAEKYTLNTNVAPYDTATSTWTGDWFILDYSSDKPGPSWATATVSSAQAHYGKQSIKLTGRYQYNGRRITGLQMNKDYYLSFWYYLPAVTTTGHQIFNWASVVPGNITTNRTTMTAGDTALASVNLQKKGTGEWTCVTIPFNSKENTEIQLITSYGTDDAADAMYIDDIGLFSGDTVQVTANAAQGGTVSASRTGIMPKGTAVLFTATPNASVTFKGWYDTNDTSKLISSNLNYAATATSDIKITAVFDMVNIAAPGAGLGGTATVSQSGAIAKNTPVTFTATPFEGNTFAGWYNVSDGTLVSTLVTYTTTATADMNLYATFNGTNKPTVERLGLGGFETDLGASFPGNGWVTTDLQYPNSVSWCSYSRTTARAYEGSYSLKVIARMRDSILPIDHLNKNTTYRISFYMYQTSGTNNYLKNAFVGSTDVIDGSNTTNSNLLSVTGRVDGNNSWQRVDLYFNTGDLTKVNFGFYYSADMATTEAPDLDAMYLDNLELYEYSANPTLLNGNFGGGKAGFFGDYAVTANGEASLTDGWDNMQQTVAVEPNKTYKVSFKAMAAHAGLKAAAVDLSCNTLADKYLISTGSYVNVTGNVFESVWINYSFTFTSGNQKAVKLLFGNSITPTLVDDIKIEVTSDIKPGDVNSDGVVDLKDVSLINRYVAGWHLTIVLPNPTVMDVNKDGFVDLVDVTQLGRYVAEWDVVIQ